MPRINGSCDSNKYDLWVDWKVNSQNETNVTSNVTITMKLQRNDGYPASAYNVNTNANTARLVVGGETKVNSTPPIDTRNSRIATLATWTGNVQHNKDTGVLNLTISGNFTIKGVSSLSHGSVSGTASLPTIETCQFYIATGGKYVQAKGVYYASGGSWKRVPVYYATGGSYKKVSN